MRKLHFLLLLFLAAFGLVISIHLTRVHYPLVYGDSKGFSFCQGGCDLVNGSRYSEFLGLPLSSLGILFYSLLFVLGMLGLLFRRAYGEFVLSWTALFSCVAVGIDAALLYISLVRLKAFCGLCGLTYLINLNCLLISLWGLLRTPRHIVLLLTQEIRRLFSFRDSLERSPGLYYRRVATFLFLTVLLSAGGSALALSYLYDASHSDPAIAPDKLRQYLDQYDQLTRVTVNSGQAPSQGPPNAPLTIVDFSDFNCPHCRHASNILARLVKEYQGQIRLVFKQFPNDSACNPNIHSDRPSNGSCLLATAALCAQAQNRFWDYHDALFAMQGKSYPEGELIALAEKLGLAKDTFSSCLRDPATGALLRAEMNEGLGLGVRGTPVLFLNGKVVRGNPPPPITRILIEKELRR